jgi:thiol-disulfide isomerase/thioredoxin
MIEVKTREELNSLLDEKEKVFIKIGHEYCGPCKLTEANILKVEPLYPDVTFVKIDSNECDEELLDGIMSVPTLIYYKKGEGQKTFTGLMTEDKLKIMLSDEKD